MTNRKVGADVTVCEYVASLGRRFDGEANDVTITR